MRNKNLHQHHLAFYCQEYVWRSVKEYADKKEIDLNAAARELLQLGLSVQKQKEEKKKQ